MGDTRDDSEKLFLLEVLVDDLTISNSSLNLDANIMSNLTDTCVLFQFLNYPPLVICESDFIGSSQGRTETSHLNFKSGKSCFFSLRTPKGPILPVPFDLRVSVIRKLREGVLPDKLDIGKVSIDMSNEFTDLLRQNAEYECDTQPTSRNKRGTFEIKDSNGKNVGALAALVRISCFGKLIITQFSLNKENEKSYLFKGTDLSKICRQPGDDNRGLVVTSDNKAAVQFPSSVGKPPISNSDDVKRAQNVNERPISNNIINNRPYDMRSDDIANYPTSPNYPRYDYGDDYKNQQYSRLDTKSCGCPQFIDTRPCGCPEITCSCLLPYKPRKSSVPESRGRGTLCECPYPVPRSVLSRYSKRPEKKMELAPGEVGLHDDQVIFQLPLKRTGDAQAERDKIKDSAVFYKLTSQEESKNGKQKNTVQIKSDEASGDKNTDKKPIVSPISGLPDDGKHDVFLLKIGKKMDGDKKRNLELELRTPRMKEPKPRTVDQDCQYKEEDAPGGKGKGKGKDDKKKGKKK